MQLTFIINMFLITIMEILMRNRLFNTYKNFNFNMNDYILFIVFFIKYINLIIYIFC